MSPNLKKHKEQHNIQTTLQHGFRSGHSCTTNDIIKIFDNKNRPGPRHSTRKDNTSNVNFQIPAQLTRVYLRAHCKGPYFSCDLHSRVKSPARLILDACLLYRTIKTFQYQIKLIKKHEISCRTGKVVGHAI